MSLELKLPQEDELPDRATHGFYLVEDDAVVYFFHWHEDGETPAPPMMVTDENGVTTAETMEPNAAVSYSDVLEALPARLAAMGYEDETTRLVKEITSKFGKQ